MKAGILIPLMALALAALASASCSSAQSDVVSIHMVNHCQNLVVKAMYIENVLTNNFMTSSLAYQADTTITFQPYGPEYDIPLTFDYTLNGTPNREYFDIYAGSNYTWTWRSGLGGGVTHDLE